MALKWKGPLLPWGTNSPDQIEIDAQVELSDSALHLVFRVQDPNNDVQFNQLYKPGERVVGLWNFTCFESFWKQSSEDPSYSEINIAPNGAWNAFSFQKYRTGMTEMPMSGPNSHMFNHSNGIAEIGASFQIPGIFTGSHGKSILQHILVVAVSAVITHRSGLKTFWSAYPQMGPPDFHHPNCFQIRL